MLDVHPSGFYAWLQQPHSQRHQADLRLTGQIKQFWLESGCVYGYRKIHLDLRDSGQQCGVNRVWRLMKRVGIKAQVGYRSPRARKGEASIVSPNRLQRQFNPDAPDERWVTDITYIRTHEGWLYLAVVVDRGYSVASVATRLDITTHSLYAWIKKYGPDPSTNKEQSDAQTEIRRLQKELKRVTDERDILKKAAVDSIGQRNSYVKTWGCGGFLNETNIYSRGKSLCF